MPCCHATAVVRLQRPKCSLQQHQKIKGPLFLSRMCSDSSFTQTALKQPSTLSPAWIAIDRTFVRFGSFVVVLKVYEALLLTAVNAIGSLFIRMLLSSIVALFIPALVSTAIEPLCVSEALQQHQKSTEHCY